MSSEHAIVLAGGRSARMGTDKAMLVLEGRTMLERVLDAVRVDGSVVVVGPEAAVGSTSGPVTFVLEDPPFGGPVAGLAAGVAALGGADQGDGALDDDVVWVFACDLPGVAGAVELLRDAAPRDDGVVLVDDQGWPQFLSGRYRVGALRRRIAEVGSVHELSMGRFAGTLDLALVAAPAEVTGDVDTPAQAEALGIEVHHPRRRPEDDAANLAVVADWTEQVLAALELPQAPRPIQEVLAMATTVAKRVARPGVPVTGYLVGLAVGVALGRGEDAQAALDAALAKVDDLAGRRPPR